MQPINLGNTVQTVQWENENEVRLYPFDGYLDGNFASADYGTPLNPEAYHVVSDLSIFVSTPYKQDKEDVPDFFLKSLYVGPGLVSMSVSNADNVLVCSVTKEDFEPYRPYPMTSVVGRCSGMCSFGDIDFGSGFSKKYENGPKVLKQLVVPVHENSVTCFIDPNTGEEVTGNVVFTLPEGTEVTRSENTDLGTNIDIFSFKLSKKYEDGVKSACDGRPGDVNLSGTLPVITNINGVRPNKNGDIAVVLK